MSETIMPCFSEAQHRAEGIIIGHLLAGYGELELEMALCVAAATKDLDAAIREMFGTRGEERRIKLARRLLQSPAADAGLGPLTNQILEDMDWCRSVRNQYAHCAWYPKHGSGLGFVNLEEVALIPGATGPMENYRHTLSLDLLGDQEAFFVYMRHCFWHLGEQFKNWAEGSSSQLFPTPAAKTRPRLHI